MTKLEQIKALLEGNEELLEEAIEEIRDSMKQDLLLDLKDWATTAKPQEHAGMRKSIQIIKANY